MADDQVQAGEGNSDVIKEPGGSSAGGSLATEGGVTGGGVEGGESKAAGGEGEGEGEEVEGKNGSQEGTEGKVVGEGAGGQEGVVGEPEQGPLEGEDSEGRTKGSGEEAPGDQPGGVEELEQPPEGAQAEQAQTDAADTAPDATVESGTEEKQGEEVEKKGEGTGETAGGAQIADSQEQAIETDSSTQPTLDPSKEPTQDPSIHPTLDPSTQPTLDPSMHPTLDPSTELTQDPSMQPTLDPSVQSTPDSSLHPSTQPTPEGVMMIDGIPVLQDIMEEEPEEMLSEENREELLDQIKLAIEEKDRLQGLNSQVQHEIAEYLARKKDDEKADPGRTVVDHEKKYLQCMGSLEHFQEELDSIKGRNHAREAEMRAQKEQKLQELQEAKSAFVQYRKEKALNVVDQRTGRKMTARDIEEFQATEDKKEGDIVQVRLESIKLQNKLTKLEGMIKQKEQLVGGLHLIDFEQLKINNVDLNEKIEERNDDILKLKKKVTSTVEVLTHVKEKLQFLQAENSEKKEALREVEAAVAKKRDHLTRMKRTRDSLRVDNLKLRQKGGLVGHTSLLRDFEERQDQSKDMYQRLEMLQKRQAELTVVCDGLKQKIEQAKYVSGHV